MSSQNSLLFFGNRTLALWLQNLQRSSFKLVQKACKPNGQISYTSFPTFHTQSSVSVTFLTDAAEYLARRNHVESVHSGSQFDWDNPSWHRMEKLRLFVFCGKNSMAQCNMAEESVYLAYILRPQTHVKSGSPPSS